MKTRNTSTTLVIKCPRCHTYFDAPKTGKNRAEGTCPQCGIECTSVVESVEKLPQCYTRKKL